MAISLNQVTIGAGESLFISIQGSSELGLQVSVSKSGQCFVEGPFNMKDKVFELTIEGWRESSQEEVRLALRI